MVKFGAWYPLILILLFLSFFEWGCGGISPAENVPPHGHHLGFRLVFREPTPAPAGGVRGVVNPAEFGVTRISVSVTAPDGTLRTIEFPYTPGGSGRVADVPSGRLLVEVRALDGSGTVIFSGSTLFEVTPDSTENEIDSLSLFAVSPAPLAILQIQSDPSETSAIIRFLTNLPARSEIRYGPGTNFTASGVRVSEIPVNNHSITLSGLASATTYGFTIRATDPANGAIVESSPQTFTTLAGFVSTAPASSTSALKPFAILAINNGAVATPNQNVVLNLSGIIGVGLLEMSINGAPFQPLNSGASYLLTAGDGLKTVTLQLRDSSGVLSDLISDTITLDTGAPAVVSTNPVNGASGISRTSTVTVTFTEPIDLATVNSLSFQLSQSGGWAVPGSYAMSGNSMIFSPAYPLVEGFFLATLTTQIKDFAGLSLSSVATFGFSVSESTFIGNINGAGASASPNMLTVLGSTLLFSADDGSGFELWSSDGSSVGLVKNINGGGSSNPGFFKTFNGYLYFTAEDGATGLEPWRSDGTSPGTLNLANIGTDPSGSAASGYHGNSNLNLLFYSASSTASGTELQVTDGATPPSTFTIDINSGVGNSLPTGFVSLGSWVLFAANGGGGDGLELWRSDGTLPGTIEIQNINPVGNSNPTNLVSNGSTVYFSAASSGADQELWKSDGNIGGAQLVKDIYPGILGGSSPGKLIFGPSGVLFFFADDGTNGQELWRSDGTSGGTYLVKNINPGGPIAPTFIYFSSAKNLLFFDATNGVNGIELWRSDGTSGGTTMVRDINPGAGNSSPGRVMELNGILYFAANDGSNGAEPWQSDGTSSGTLMIKNLNPGVNPSNPMEFTALGNLVIFSADDGTNGTELHKLTAY